MLQGIFGGLASWGPDFIRLGVAFTFILHGYPKLFGPKPGPKGFAGYIGSMGFPSPLFFAYAAGITEFVGGVCILLGFLTRFWALVGAIEFLTIILKVKWSKGFLISNEGWEWDWAILMMLLSLLVTGPGRVARCSMSGNANIDATCIARHRSADGYWFSRRRRRLFGWRAASAAPGPRTR